MDELILAIDASRCRSGGAQVHLVNLICEGSPEDYGISKVHLWSFSSLLDSIPNKPWLVKHYTPELDRGLGRQILWQIFKLESEVKKHKCDGLFTVDASTFCNYRPMITLSQDLLSYEPGMIEMHPWGLDKLRLWLILYLQNRAFRRSKGVIFLSNYAADLIQKFTGPLRAVSLIPHGIGDLFLERPTELKSELSKSTKIIKCTYVSHIEVYKNQLNVVRAIKELRLRGYAICVDLIGGGNKKTVENFLSLLKKEDPDNNYARYLGPKRNDQLPTILKETDVFIFASSCENMPNTLIEAMALGLPIACSQSGPMPDILQEGGVYFDPKNHISIADAIQRIIDDNEFRNLIAKKAHTLAQNYSWKKCSDKTFEYIASMLKDSPCAD